MHPGRVLFALLLLAPALAWAGLGMSFQQSGHLGLEVAGVAGGNGTLATGTLTLSQMPPTGTTVRATLYASQVNNGTGLDAIFAGNNLGSVAPYAADIQLLGTHAYAWDVTTLVLGPVASYSFTIGQTTLTASAIAGVALVVVW